IEQHENVLAGFDDATAALDHEAREADVRIQIHVVRRRDDFGLHRALEIRDFFRAFVNQQNHRVNFWMIRRDGVANLFEDGGFARARWRDGGSTGSGAAKAGWANRSWRWPCSTRCSNVASRCCSWSPTRATRTWPRC